MDWKSSYNTGLEFEHKIDKNALEMFKKMLANNRNSPLIHYYGSTLTSNDVDFQSDVLATAIQEETKKRNIILNKGDRIALYMQNTPEYLISMLSIWKLGCTGVNINPMYKNSELSHIIKDSTPKVIISLGDIYKENIIPLNFDIYTIICFPTDYLHVSALTKYKVVFGADNYDNFDVQEGPKVSYFQSLLSRYRKYKHFENDSFHELLPEDVAFLTYTSGTTAGLGKGAMNSHKNVCFSTRNLQQWVRLSPNDTILGVAPLFHITGLILNLSAALSIGCPVVLTYRFSPTVVAHLIERYKCTMTCGSITLYSALMNDKNANLFNISSLTKAFSGGAPISPSIVNNFYKQFSIMITPIYGLTESTAPSHSTPLYATAPVDEKFGALSIGIPMYEIDSKIVDENGVEVAHGDVGEIVIKGPNVISGYWNLPEKTKETFDKNGYLKTGDVGFRDQRGFFFLVDRKKDLIISSGYKIWPREVEDVIMQIEGVLECGVVGIPDDYRGETVKAFLSCKEGYAITPEKVIDYCKSKMAAYKYPRFVEIVKEVPKNLSGKILRRSLRPPSKSNL